MAEVSDSLLASLREFIDARPHLFTAGLSDQEFDEIEARFEFRFPPDLRAFLGLGLPNSISFPDWRSGSEEDLRGQLDWPARGICFDIEHDDFWLEDWGPRPNDLNEAFAVALDHISAAPTLIPIFSHRFIPEEPLSVGNPVFSVYQTDIIYYGSDLLDYLRREFRESRVALPPSVGPHKPIRFWSDLVLRPGPGEPGFTGR